MDRRARLSLFTVIVMLTTLYVACSCEDGGFIEVEQNTELKEASDPKISGQTCDLYSLRCEGHHPDGRCSIWWVHVKSPGTCDVTFEFKDGTTTTRRLVFRTPSGACDCGAPDEVPSISARGPRDPVDAATPDGAPPEASGD